MQIIDVFLIFGAVVFLPAGIIVYLFFPIIWIPLIAFFLSVACGVYFWLRREKYPVQVSIWERRGNVTVQTRFDKAGTFKSGGKSGRYRLYSNGKELPNVSFSSIFNLPGNKPFLPLYSPNRDEYSPMTIREITVDEIERDELGEPILDEHGNAKTRQGKRTVFEPLMNEAAKLIYSEGVMESADRWRRMSFLEKYGFILSICLTGIIIVIMIYVTLSQLQPIAESMAKASESSKEAAQSIASAMQTLSQSCGGKLTGQTPIPLPPT